MGLLPNWVDPMSVPHPLTQDNAWYEELLNRQGLVHLPCAQSHPRVMEFLNSS